VILNHRDGAADQAKHDDDRQCVAVPKPQADASNRWTRMLLSLWMVHRCREPDAAPSLDAPIASTFELQVADSRAKRFIG